MKNHTQRHIVAGTGPSLGLLAASMVTAFAAHTEAAPSVKPHVATSSTDRDRAYDIAIAGGCKSPSNALDKSAPFASTPHGRHCDFIALGTSTIGRHTLHDADEYAKKATNAITGAVSEFGRDFKFIDESANLGAAVGGNQINWHPALSGS